MKKFFGKIGGFCKKHKVGVIIFGVILLIVIFLFWGCVSALNNAVGMLNSMTETGEVTYRNLVKSIGATGKVVAVDTKDITTTLTGMKATDVYVKVGDMVTVGDQLVKFDTTDIEKSLADTKQQLNVQNANAALQAQDRERSLADTQRNQNSAVIVAWDNFEAAQKRVELAESAWRYASKEYADAQKALEADPTDPALISNKNYKDNAEEVARAELENAKTALETAERNRCNAEATMQSALASQNSQNQQGANSASISGITFQNQIKKLEQQLEDGLLKAPISGLVTAVNIAAGDTYAGGVVVTVQDVSGYVIETEIGEYDISDIEVGKKVIIKTDATRDEELDGTVIFVSPTATASAGSTNVTYKVKVSVNTKNDRLRLGMSAALSVIIDSHENVMTVPYSAIQQEDDGRYYVQRAVDLAELAKKSKAEKTGNKEQDATDGKDATVGNNAAEMNGIDGEKVYVEVVMESNYYTEIKSDELKEGDKVMLISEGSPTDMMMELMMNGEGF